VSKIKIEKAQLIPIMVVTGNHNLLIGKELGYGSSSYYTWANGANVF
jgi:cobalamin biosynthesis Co2+ chelatase CbiK